MKHKTLAKSSKAFDIKAVVSGGLPSLGKRR